MFRKSLLSVTLSVALFGLTACNGNDSSPAAPSALANQYQNVIDRSGTRSSSVTLTATPTSNTTRCSISAPGTASCCPPATASGAALPAPWSSPRSTACSSQASWTS
jgi:hypothetical protein